MALGIEGPKEHLSLLKKEVFKISKRVTRIGEKLKIDMGLNSNEEDEELDNIEGEDDEFAQDVLGSDEDGENDSVDAQTLKKDDDSLDVPESDKEVSKDDAELSEGHSEEPMDKRKDSTENSEEVVEDDSDNVPLVKKRKELRQNKPADAETSEGINPSELLGRFKQSTGILGSSSAPKGKCMRVNNGVKKPPRKNPIPTKHVG
ncbi:hypothetical protein LIER_23380 [Lithospermum erythrorhizon]|uniref:Uncharacterized protein n=1 Tax=Lithospermum erythrorhizon TaxID=34254 RepID=A0AAV3QYI9_LITER